MELRDLLITAYRLPDWNHESVTLELNTYWSKLPPRWVVRRGSGFLDEDGFWNTSPAGAEMWENPQDGVDFFALFLKDVPDVQTYRARLKAATDVRY